MKGAALPSAPTPAMSAPSDGPNVSGYVIGLAAGVGLSMLYVRFGWEPPVIGLPAKIEGAAVSVAADLDLSDPTRPVEIRQRALATVLSRNPAMVIELDDATGHGLLAAWDRLHARAAAARLDHRGDAIDRALRYDALRDSLERKYGTADEAEIKAAMLREAAEESPYLRVASGGPDGASRRAPTPIGLPSAPRE